MKTIFVVICMELFVQIHLSKSEITKINTLITKQEHFEPNWESLDSRPLPKWYDDAKVGIFIHWGVYSVPSYGSEWFWINWKGENNTGYVDYMTKNYKPGFTYQEFANDFTGEHFNPHEWAQIFEKSGAKYVVLTSKHHDGYSLWPSKYSFSWNSMDVGPHRDIVGEFANAIKLNTTLKFGLYHSLFEWFNPMYLDDKQHLFRQSKFIDFKILPELKEIVNKYHPELIWSDGEWEASDIYWQSKEFISWLYNESPVRNTVVINDRWGNETLCKHGGYHTCTDRFNPGVLKTHKWENAMTIDKKSWGQRANAKLEDFVTSKELIKELVTTVSCGGNILVNVGPTKAGIIEPIFVERLYDMGRWLNTNGEAIYETIPWIHQNDSITSGVWYTAGIPRNNYKIIYAIILDYPYDEAGIILFSMGHLLNIHATVQLLGYDEKLQYYESNESVYVTFPKKRILDKLGLSFAWTLKFSIPEF